MQEFSEQKKWILEKTIEQIRQKSTKELTADDIFFLKNQGIINGCGARVIRDENYENFFRNIFAKISQILAKIIRPVFFEASCDLHDFGYWKGWDEAKRLECDKKFLQKILEDIENFSKNFFEKIFYKILAKLFYIAVRIGGRQFFNYY